MLIFMDGDGQHDPSCIPRLLSRMDKVDMRICSRFRGETAHKYVVKTQNIQ